MSLNSSLWQQNYQQNFTVATNGIRFVPLPAIDIPVTFDKSLVAISTSSFNSPPKWVTGGWVSQKIYTGLTIENNNDATLTNQRVFLNKLNLFKFSLDLASSYTLNYAFPRWIKDISIAIWEYQGDISSYDPNDIPATLQRLEDKIDDLAGGF
ncbi:hypothetical protein [Calothrix sp. PCC 6303]|jgi:hypothetical protein|uniref:hypothetical protein n=1 Tax=Calothrix sp. PCC 6303 TaxID=1170562 RepID=UPI0002A03E64|nr:hypothetical protein [Calothrix sp. PCC 6303]AFZ01628.1 hypothetical protein Cal6303_2655 [Calothrix sp. PCC 6303]